VNDNNNKKCPFCSKNINFKVKEEQYAIIMSHYLKFIRFSAISEHSDFIPVFYHMRIFNTKTTGIIIFSLL